MQSAIAPEAQGLRKPAAILLVDGARDDRAAIAALLGAARYAIFEAETLDEGLRIVMDSPIDAILLSAPLPGTTCEAGCQRIRAIAGLQELPLLLLSAQDDPGSVVRGLDAGADDYLPKSVDGEVLKARLRVQLRRRGIVNQCEPVRAAPGAGEPPAQRDSESELDAYTLARLQDSVNLEGVFELIDALLTDTPKRLVALFAALEAKDAPEIVRQAHQLKSSAAIFGGLRIAASCAELEAMGRGGRLDEATSAATSLKARLERFSQELREARRKWAESR